MQNAPSWSVIDDVLGLSPLGGHLRAPSWDSGGARPTRLVPRMNLAPTKAVLRRPMAVFKAAQTLRETGLLLYTSPESLISFHLRLARLE